MLTHTPTGRLLRVREVASRLNGAAVTPDEIARKLLALATEAPAEMEVA